MKIKTGFISNSSTSSFIVLGKDLNWEEVKKNYKELIQKKQLYGHSYDNPEICEGVDFFRMTRRMIEQIINHGLKIHLGFVQVFQITSSGQKLNKLELPDEEFSISFIEQSNNSYLSENFDYFANIYLNMSDETPQEIKQLVQLIDNKRKQIGDIDLEINNILTQLYEKGYELLNIYGKSIVHRWEQEEEKEKKNES